jgi:predicted RNA methylase
MKQAHKLIIGALVLLVLFVSSRKYFLTDNKETILHLIDPRTTTDSLPTTQDNLARINSYIKKDFPDNSKKYTLIDFGCGYGEVLLGLHDNFKSSIGIEIDSTVCKKAKKNVQQYHDIMIVNKDMAQYNFKKTNTVLFMYEPLWSVEKKTADEIYNNVFNKINTVFQSNSATKFYIIYVTGLKRKDIDETVIKKHKFNIIKKFSIGKKFVERYIYILNK